MAEDSSKVKVSRAKRSPAWVYFEDLGPKAKCKLCSREYVRQTGTSSLFAHLKTAHPKQYASAVGAATPGEGRTSAGTLPVGTFCTTPARPCSSARSSIITDLVLDWIAGSMRPLSIVTDSGLAVLLQELAPAYKLPSRTHFATLLRNRHARCKAEMKALLLNEASAGVALTTDGWTSTGATSYVTHTVHYITREWQLVSGVLETGKFSGSHTAAALADYSKSVLERFGLPSEQVASITHDEAANMVAAGRRLSATEGWSSNVCMAHLMQTAIRHALEDSRAIDKLLAHCRRLVGHFRHSCLATEALTSRQVQLNREKAPLKVVQDVCTRWNSSFYMLRRLVALRVPLTAVLCDKETTPKEADRQLLLKDHQWALAEELVAVLSHLEAATTVVSGQKYVTMALMLPVATRLETIMSSLADSSTNATARAFARSLSAELSSKFPCIASADTESPAVLSAALDPRFHDLDFLSDEERREVKDVLLEKMGKLKKAKSDDDSQDAAPPPPKIKKEDSSLSLLLGKRSTTSTAPADESVQLKKEVQLYFAEDTLELEKEPLAWWQKNENRFPHLAQLARRYLAIPATSVPSEQVFSAAGLLLAKIRSALSPANIDASIFLAKNATLPSARSRPSAESAQVEVASARDCPPEALIEEEEELVEIPPLPEL